MKKISFLQRNNRTIKRPMWRKAFWLRVSGSKAEGDPPNLDIYYGKKYFAACFECGF